MQTVLVVDDSDALRDLVNGSSRTPRLHGVPRRDVQDARQLCARHPAIDVLLTDVVMAGPTADRN